MQPNVCYGKDGEDLVLNRLLGAQVKGFYVDVGAHHPVRFSNTDMLNLANCPVVQFLQSVGYTTMGKAYNTSFFAREGD